jgi:hypothetical protein
MWNILNSEVGMRKSEKGQKAEKGESEMMGKCEGGIGNEPIVEWRSTAHRG